MRLTDSGVWAVIIMVVLFWGQILKGTSQSTLPFPETHQGERTFLEWDDMNVDLNYSSSTNSCRVIVVDKNGGGDSVTVQGAVDVIPEQNRIRHKIYIRPGIYSEKVHVPKSKPFISFIGDENQSAETVITWHDKASDRKEDGSVLGTYESASVTVESDYFCARGVTFENSVVSLPGTYDMQAVALRINGDKAWLYKVRLLGTQDTLLDESGLHFYDQCFIQGSVDFICGNAKSLFQDCTLNSVATEAGAIAANHRESSDEDTGFSFVNCNVTGSGQVFLGRAWGYYSRVVYSYCNFDNIVDPRGWDDWSTPDKDRTVEFGEFQCRGEGASRTNRVPWSRDFSFLEAEFTLTTDFIYGRRWLDPFSKMRFVNDRW